MPKHITLSRRKQSAPLDLDAFKEKRNVREQAKKATKAASVSTAKAIDVDEDKDKEEVVVPVNDVVKKRKNEKKDTTSKKGKCVMMTIDDDGLVV